MLGGDGIIQYQVVATLFAAATAILIGHWVRRLSGWVAGLAAGLLYLVLLHRLSGMGGHSEVFLNLFVVAAAYLIARHLPPLQTDASRSNAKLLEHGATAMLLCGTALQLKTTAAFSGSVVDM